APVPASRRAHKPAYCLSGGRSAPLPLSPLSHIFHRSHRWSSRQAHRDYRSPPPIARSISAPTSSPAPLRHNTISSNSHISPALPPPPSPASSKASTATLSPLVPRSA